MDREGDGAEYDSYHITKETETMWAREFIDSFLKSEMTGREAFRMYSSVTELTGRDSRKETWNTCLYYPLRTKHLDDATILFMLGESFQMAEAAAKKRRFSKADAAAYLQELDRYIEQVQDRAESETLTRDADYVRQDFSDPAYVKYYLSSLRKKWTELFR